MSDLLSFQAARAAVLRDVMRVAAERVPLADALGRVLAESVVANGPLPPFSYSAMDGYAVAADALTGAPPWELVVSGESRTGHLPERFVPGTSCRISTGARIPVGADAVVPVELVEERGERIRLSVVVKEGQHVRPAGQDLAAGAVALEAGERLGASALGLAASLDRTELSVARQPRVAILATGDELRAAGAAPRPGSIPDSVSLPLAALARQAGARPHIVGPVPDDRAATEHAVRAALEGSDLLLTVGGVSVGRHDWVRPALEAEGVSIEFHAVAIKPGKPLTFGRRGKDGPMVLALPGNPASALVTFALFGMPLVRAMQGDKRPLPRTLVLPLATRAHHKPGRLEFLRARLELGDDGLMVAPLANQASGALTSLAWSDAFALLPADAEELAAGTPIEVVTFADL